MTNRSPGESTSAPRPQSSCFLSSTLGVDCEAKTVASAEDTRLPYDQSFADRLPQTDDDFGWRIDADVVSGELVNSQATYALPPGLYEGEYHELMDFDPNRFERTTAIGNAEIFAQIENPRGDVYAPYRRFNPTDFLPVTVTHYERTEETDVMAIQFAYRAACFPRR